MPPQADIADALMGGAGADVPPSIDSAPPDFLAGRTGMNFGGWETPLPEGPNPIPDIARFIPAAGVAAAENQAAADAWAEGARAKLAELWANIHTEQLQASADTSRAVQAAQAEPDMTDWDFGAQAIGAGLGGGNTPDAIPPGPPVPTARPEAAPFAFTGPSVPQGEPPISRTVEEMSADVLRRPGVSDLPDTFLGHLTDLVTGPFFGAGRAAQKLMADPGSIEATGELGLNLMGIMPGGGMAMKGEAGIAAMVSRGVSRETATKIAVGNLKSELAHVQAAREAAGIAGEPIPGIAHLDDVEAALDRIAARPPAEGHPGLTRLDEIQRQIRDAAAATVSFAGDPAAGAEEIAAAKAARVGRAAAGTFNLGGPGGQEAMSAALAARAARKADVAHPYSLPPATEAAPFAAENTARLGSLETIPSTTVVQDIAQRAPLGGAEIAAQNAVSPRVADLPVKTTGPMTTERLTPGTTQRFGGAITRIGESIEARPGFQYRSFDRPIEAIGEDVSMGSKPFGFGGPYEIEVKAGPRVNLGAGHPGEYRGALDATKVTRVFYEPAAWTDPTLRLATDLPELKRMFPQAEFVEVKLADDAETRIAQAVNAPVALGAQTIEAAGPPLLAEVRAGRIVRYAPEPTTAEAAAGPATSSAGREFAGNIRLGKYQPQEVRDNIAAMYDAAPDRFEAARRGVVTDAEVRDLATRAGADPEKTLARWKPGVAGNAETIQALRTALDTAAMEVRSAHAVYQTAQGAEAPTALSNLLEALTRHAAYQEAVSGVTAEAGRALRVFKQDVSPDQKVLAALHHMAPGTTPEGLARLLKDVNFDDPVAVAKAAKDLYSPKPIDWANWWFYNSLLSGPRGRLLDTISSAISAITAPLETAVAVPFDIARSAITRTPREVFLKEVPAEYIGMQAAVADGWRDALSVMAHGPHAETARQDIQVAAREPIRGGAKGIAANAPTRLVAANDAFFSAINKSAAENGLAIAQATKEGLNGPEAAARAAELIHSGALAKEATRLGRYRVFQEGGALVSAISNLKNTEYIGPAIRFLVPFHATAINLTKMAAERSPLGFVELVGRVAGAGPAISQREISLGLSRAAIGSTIMAGTVSLARQGLVTGAAPPDEADRDAFFRQGKQPYSILIGGKWQSYQALPISPVLGAAATVAEAVAEGRLDDAFSIATIGALGFAKAMIEQPFLQGTANMLDALDDPKRFGENYVENVVRMPIPQALQSLTRATDAIIRNPHGAGEAIQSVVPGLSGNIGARQSAFGENVTRPEGQQGLGAINPFKPSELKSDPVETELARLQMKGLKVEPGFVGSTLSEVGQSVKLSREQLDIYQRMSGKMAYGLILGLVEGAGWASIPDTTKANLIEDMVRMARATTRPRGELLPAALEKLTGKAPSGFGELRGRENAAPPSSFGALRNRGTGSKLAS